VLPLVAGRPEGCLVCHKNTTGLGASHRGLWERYEGVARDHDQPRADEWPTILHHEIDLLQVVQVLIRSSIHHDDVRELAGLQASELVVHVEQLGVRDGRGLQRLRD
jgi:hypothetical protein